MHVLHHLVGHVLAGHVVGRVDGHEDLLLRREHGADALPVEQPLQVVGLLEVDRLGHGQVGVLGRGHRDHLELLQKPDGHPRHEERVEAGRQTLHHRQPALGAPRREQVGLADAALLHEDLAEPAALVPLHRQRAFQILGREPAGLPEYLPQGPDHRIPPCRPGCTTVLIGPSTGIIPFAYWAEPPPARRLSRFSRATSRSGSACTAPAAFFTGSRASTRR